LSTQEPGRLLRLTTSLTCVGCSTGISAGLKATGLSRSRRRCG
jgi:hypothetical protein